MAFVILVSPRPTVPHDVANPLAERQRFLNFGLLSLATVLWRLGHRVTVVDECCSPAEVPLAQHLLELAAGTIPTIVGVSCISANSADRVTEILELTNHLWPDVPRVVGGQHFVGSWGFQFPSKLPMADVLVAGEGESALIALAERLDAVPGRRGLECLEAGTLPSNIYWRSGRSVRQGVLPAGALPMDEVVQLQYPLYGGHEVLFPAVEYSRGCPRRCLYCANTEANRRTYRRASAAMIAAAIRGLAAARLERPLRFYMQASNFTVSHGEAEELTSAFSQLELPLEWRAEVRVDGLDPRELPLLARGGLRILDLGLESASLQTLGVMRKASDPAGYLNRAERLLEAARENAIRTRVNFLVHPGDTPRTLAESHAWLSQQRRNISGISAGVAVEYAGAPLGAEFKRLQAEHGTKREPHPLSQWGVNGLRPSSALSSEEASRFVLSLMQELQSRDRYAELKAFGYLGAWESAQEAIESLPEATATTPYGPDEKGRS